jgi:hypothetical protein
MIIPSELVRAAPASSKPIRLAAAFEGDNLPIEGIAL